MPIVIDRHTHEVVCKPEITREMKDTAWEIIISNYVRRHPEILEYPIQNNGSEEGEI